MTRPKDPAQLAAYLARDRERKRRARRLQHPDPHREDQLDDPRPAHRRTPTTDTDQEDPAVTQTASIPAAPTIRPLGRVGVRDFYTDDRGAEYERRAGHVAPQAIPAALATGATVYELVGRDGKPTGGFAALDPVAPGTAAAAARELEVADYLARRPEAQARVPYRLKVTGYDTAADVLRVLEVRNGELRRDDGILAWSVGDYHQARHLADALELFGELVGELLAGRRPGCEVKGCKGSALFAVAAATSSGRAFVCQPHGTGELPLEPARIPKELGVPSALGPIPADDPIVMAVVQLGEGRAEMSMATRDTWAKVHASDPVPARKPRTASDIFGSTPKPKPPTTPKPDARR